MTEAQLRDLLREAYLFLGEVPAARYLMRRIYEALR
jgi:hypothetical protein